MRITVTDVKEAMLSCIHCSNSRKCSLKRAVNGRVSLRITQ